MNEAGKQYELAVKFANFWDKIYSWSGAAGIILVSAAMFYVMAHMALSLAVR